VVLSRRVTVLLMAVAVAVMALGIMGVLRAVSAAPNNNAEHNRNDGEGRSTLTVMTKSDRQIGVADVGPQGPSQGDMRVVSAPLYNESGKKKVGRFDLFGVMTDPADESSEKAHMTERTFTYNLPGGEISAQGLAPYPKFDRPAPRSVDVVTGGTGRYAGVKGEVRYETRGTKVIHTFRFID
jgi:hypothetical protein